MAWRNKCPCRSAGPEPPREAKVKAEDMNFPSALAGDWRAPKAMGVMHGGPGVTSHFITAWPPFRAPAVHSSVQL